MDHQGARDELTAEEATLTFEVHDTGAGVAPEAIDELFVPFRQADNTMTRRFGGTGLGLSICKHLVGLMGGEIELESELGRGTLVRFTACFGADVQDQADEESRLDSVEGPSPAPTSDPDARGLQVLLVEDNGVNRMLMSTILKREGHIVTEAVDGQEAVDVFSPSSFDVILMDCQTPHMDGYEATRTIRRVESECGAHPTVIVAVTANALHTDRARCREAGMNDFISKPFVKEEVIERLNYWRSRALVS
ncbi:MAG: response regulator [bacterium]|nr:response regulator [bacterium]